MEYCITRIFEEGAEEMKKKSGCPIGNRTRHSPLASRPPRPLGHAGRPPIQIARTTATQGLFSERGGGTGRWRGPFGGRLHGRRGSPQYA